LRPGGAPGGGGGAPPAGSGRRPPAGQSPPPGGGAAPDHIVRGGRLEEARTHPSVVTVQVEVGHDQTPDRLTELLARDVVQAAEDRGCVVWGSSSGCREIGAAASD
jgi:hypothetical protein